MSSKVAVSDLHSRMDFLVAYSSQLIFIANDNLQFQQSTLQSFIAQQHENIEVAFLKGEPNRHEEDYRKEICRQILHKTTGQFDASLRTVLQDFETVENPVLICLCAAQEIPHELLKELWELVLLARTLNKNLHVNVVLFGDCQWVTDAKNRLPKNSGNQPVVLTTELDVTTSTQNDTQEQSELEALIANKRAAFAQRIQARSNDNPIEHKQTLIQTRKFQITVGIVLIAIFATLVFWFYPQQKESAAQTKPDIETQIDSAATTPEVEAQFDSPATTAEVKTQIDSPATTPEVETQIDSPAPDVETQIDSPTPTPEVETAESSESLPESSIEPLVDKLLVTQWQNSGSAELHNELEPNAPSSVDEQELRSLEKPSPSVHPLAEVEPGQFLIQISSTGNLQAAERFIKANSLQQSTWIYSTKRFENSWYVIVYKKLFESKNEARKTIGTLSEQLKKSSPFVKSIEKIQEEIAIAN